MTPQTDHIRCLCGWQGPRADLRRLPSGPCCPACGEDDNLFPGRAPAAPIGAPA